MWGHGGMALWGVRYGGMGCGVWRYEGVGVWGCWGYWASESELYLSHGNFKVPTGKQRQELQET